MWEHARHTGRGRTGTNAPFSTKATTRNRGRLRCVPSLASSSQMSSAALPVAGSPPVVKAKLVGKSV